MPAVSKLRFGHSIQWTFQQYTIGPSNKTKILYLKFHQGLVAEEDSTVAITVT